MVVVVARPHHRIGTVEEAITKPLMLKLLRLNHAAPGGGGGGGGGVDVVQDLIEGLQPVGELHHLSPEH